jgi:hexosaminidase
MSWRGTAGGIAAARAGHDVVMAPTGNTYLDYAQSRDPNEPVGQTALLTLDKVYAFDPVPDELEPQFVKHVLGGQAQVWTEYMADAKAVEYMAFPRLTALAEAVWTQKDRKNYANYLERLRPHLERLRALDVNVHPLVVTQ